MTISPCAMLMTPITPNVMARPMAARRSTEPSEMPYQTFCPTLQMARDWLIWAIPASRMTSWASLAPPRAELRIDSAVRSPRTAMVSTASSNASPSMSVSRSVAARACSMMVRTPASSSAAMAVSSNSRLPSSGLEIICCAADRRVAGLSLISVRLPIAAAMSRRSELLIRMTLISPVMSRSAASPVRASVNWLRPVSMKMPPLSASWSAPSPSARRMGRAPSSPLATSAATASRNSPRLAS